MQLRNRLAYIKRIYEPSNNVKKIISTNKRICENITWSKHRLKYYYNLYEYSFWDFLISLPHRAIMDSGRIERLQKDLAIEKASVTHLYKKIEASAVNIDYDIWKGFKVPHGSDGPGCEFISIAKDFWYCKNVILHFIFAMIGFFVSGLYIFKLIIE